MVSQMTHWERIRATLSQQVPDRLPVSMWRHFYGRETSPEGLASAMMQFQQQFDWDFMKVNPRASYHVEDWGVEVRYEGGAAPNVIKTPVKTPEDWLKLRVLDINKGVLGDQLRSLELLGSQLRGETPFIMTVFTPIAIASRLIKSEDMFARHLREHTDNVQQALEVITETFTRFSRACLDRGVSGLFYATTAWATRDRLSEDEYRQYARPFDLKLLNALPAAEFHVLHVCRERNLLNAVNDYPVHAFNWDAHGDGNLSLSEGRALIPNSVVIGGLPHERKLVEASPEQITAEITGMKIALGWRGWILGPGCTFLPETPEDNIRAVRDAVDR